MWSPANVTANACGAATCHRRRPHTQNRDKQRLVEQQRGAAILQEQLAERERQRLAAEELRDQVGAGLWLAARSVSARVSRACQQGWWACLGS